MNSFKWRMEFMKNPNVSYELTEEELKLIELLGDNVKLAFT